MPEGSLGGQTIAAFFALLGILFVLLFLLRGKALLLLGVGVALVDGALRRTLLRAGRDFLERFMKVYG